MARNIIPILIAAACTGLAGVAGIWLAQHSAVWLIYALMSIAFVMACIGLLMFLVQAAQKEPSANKFAILMLSASSFVAALAIAKDGAEFPAAAFLAFAMVGPIMLLILHFGVWIAQLLEKPKAS